MSSEQPTSDTPVPVVEAAPPTVPGTAPGAAIVPRGLVYALIAVAAASLLVSGLLWQKLSNIQEQLARQSQDAGNNAIEARTLAKQAQELARDTAARQAVLDTRLAEVALQRSQVEELIQSLSRSRDENTVVDIESALRLAQQQAQVTGSVDPLLAALRSADQRLERGGPRLARVRGAVLRDIDRIRSANVADIPGLLARIDEIARQVDELPLANAVAPAPAASARRKEAPPPRLSWWEQALADVREEARGLLRVSRVDQPEAVLLAPEQGFFVRENLKLKLLNARLEVLSRQVDSARADVGAAVNALRKYFDPNSRRTQALVQQLQQVQSQLRSAEMPRIDETLAVLATAAAGK